MTSQLKYDMKQDLLNHIKALPEEVSQGVLTFLQSYRSAHTSPETFAKSIETLTQYIEQLKLQLRSPYTFANFHQKEREPFDFYQMARNLVEPLIDRSKSSVRGVHVVQDIDDKLARGENVLFLANHQTEPDPQIISLLIEQYSRRLAEDMVYVAGHRVTTDPMAVPMSRGCNLICIYSKKYIEHPPEMRTEKLQHNARSLAKMEELLNQGGAAIYVAPSGGRDRWDEEGRVAIASFDPQSVELFRLLAKKARRPTHIHLLTLSTINILPPPKGIQVALGEQRIASSSPVHLDFSEECIFDEATTHVDKIERRKQRAEMLTEQIRKTYNSFFDDRNKNDGSITSKR